MKLLSIIGLLFNFIGTPCLAKGLLLSNKQIDLISGTYWGYNKDFKNSMLNNRTWAIIGFILIILGLAFQFISILKGK